MRHCSSRILLLAFVTILAPLAVRAQTTIKPSAPAAPAVEPSPLQPEAQPSLDVDRDPILSPDAKDNLPVSPNQPTPGVALHRKNGVYTLRRNVDEVVLNCTVVDSKGQVVNGLTKNDFKVWEDNVPQKIIAFQHSDLPVSMGILIDNSGSMRDKRSAVNEAALDLVRASNPDDEAFVVNFSDEAYLDQDFTSSIAQLRQGLSHISARGGTALYDAVVASADHLAKHAHHPKQVLLIVTDGEDNASSLDLEQTIRRVQDLQGPEIYSIGLLFGNDAGRAESRRARKALELLSDETGGIAFFPHSLADVDQIAAEVARDIRNQYTIGYHSTKPPRLGGYRVVKVEARGPHHQKLFVRTKPGYYPKPLGTAGGKQDVAETQTTH